MGRILLRILGAAIGAYAIQLAMSVALFRLDSAGDLEWLFRMDVLVGFMFVAAVILLRTPAAGAGTARWHALTAVAGIVVWATVSGVLAWSHLEQYRIRSTPPVLEA